MRNLFMTLTAGVLVVAGCSGHTTDPAVTLIAATTIPASTSPATTIPATTTTAPPQTTLADSFQDEEQRAAVQIVERQIDLFFGITEQQLASFFERTNFAIRVDVNNSEYVESQIDSFGPYIVPFDASAYLLGVSLGTFRVTAANGDELVIMPIGLMNRKAESKKIIYTIADAYAVPSRRDSGTEPTRQWKMEALYVEGQHSTVTVNARQLETITYPVGNERIKSDVSLGHVGELPADYFSPQGALPIVAVMYASSVENFGGDSGLSWYGLDPARMQQLFLALEGAMTKTTADDIPGVYCVRADAHVPINEINEIASFRNAWENLVSVFGFRVIPEIFPG